MAKSVVDAIIVEDTIPWRAESSYVIAYGP